LSRLFQRRSLRMLNGFLFRLVAHGGVDLQEADQRGAAEREAFSAGRRCELRRRATQLARVRSSCHITGDRMSEREVSIQRA
jgi:hypothetical protein